MGRTVTPKYRLEIWDGRPLRGLFNTVAGPNLESWNTRTRGRPSATNLQTYIEGYAASLKHGGVNAHISKMFGFIPFPRKARIVEQRTGREVAYWEADRFQVF